MSTTSMKRGPAACTTARRPLRGVTLLAAAVALGLASWAGPAFAEVATPSMEEMWQIIQKQQAEIDRLKNQNVELQQKVAASPIRGSTCTAS